MEEDEGNLRLASLDSTKRQLELQLQCFKHVLEPDSIDVDALKTRFESSKGILTQYLRVFQELITKNPAAYPIDTVLTFEKQYYEILAQANAFIHSVDPRSNMPGTSLENQSVASPFPVTDQYMMKSYLKPPKIPTIDGKKSEWPAFIQMFNSLVHNNTALSNILKFHYLKISLSGKALDLIKHLKFVENNYAAALNTLKEKYEDKKALLNVYMKSLLDFDDPCQCRIDSRLRAKDVERINNKITQTLEALVTLEIDTTTWDPFIIHVATSRFDRPTLSEWEKVTTPKELPTRKQLLDFLKKRSRILEAVETHGSKL
ncbi:unnamed protein product [Bemisia tabaci]|uniref:Uncharacterized protein n=1 Tax=Bemisia tabaci TaxID=7038 RepID=A0A9P0A428_BEMTA|nr:unnamed protein product [Bemisia tabaci]